jgi:hypothetical protein
MLGSSVNTVHDITLKYIEYVGPGLDSLNVDPQAIASISCVGSSTAQISLVGQRNHAYLFVGEWVTIGGTANHAKDTADTLTAGPQQIGSTTNGQMTGCTEIGTIATCVMRSYVPTISTDRSQNVIIVSNSVAGYNGTWPVTGINVAAKTISFDVGGTPNSLGPGSNGNATWNGSVGVQIQSVTQGSAVCAPGVQCSNDWTLPFTVSGNGYTCSGLPEVLTGVMAGPDALGGGGIDLANGVTNGTFIYSYGHDFLGLWDMGGDTNITIQGNACERIYGNPISPFHASCLADGSGGPSNTGSNGLTFAYNRILDTESTGDVGALYRSGTNPTSQNWNIYGNVFGHSDGNPYRRGNNGNGQVFCINSIICTNWNILNNTIVGDGTPLPTHWGFEQSGGPTVTNVVCENNLASNATQSNGTWSNSLCTTTDYNSYFNLGASQPTTGLGPHGFTSNSVPNPFTDSLLHIYMLSLATGPLGCTVGTNCLQDGLNTHTLLPANDLDPNSTPRGSGFGWYRGAFQYVAPTPPSPGSALTTKGVY